MKKSGVALLATIISIAVLLLVSGGFFTIMASNTGLIKSGGESLQAQYFAQLEADTIKMLSYDEVDNITQDTWQEFDIDNAGQYKVNVGLEQNVGDSDNTMKIASISVRKNGDTINRFALDVPLSSQGSNTLPVGTILPYVGDLSKIPHGWALCDGNNGTPNLKGMFLRGWGQQIINGNTYSATTVKNYQLDAIKDTFGKGSIVTTSANINSLFSNKNPATGVFSYETDWGYYVGGDIGYANHALKIKFDMTAGQNTSNEFRPINYTVYYIMHII